MNPWAHERPAAGREPVPECSIIVPLYNRSLFTRLFLLALRGVLPEKPRCEVLLVDNGSSDDTRTVLAELASEHRVITLEANRNFAGGCNAGAAVSRGKYLYFLNNDTVPLPGFVETLVEALERDASFAIAGSRLLYPDGRIQHAGLGINRARLPAHLYHLCPFDLPAANRRRVVQAVTGASLLIRRAEFEALGGFDGGFRNSFEDVDLCLKAGALGGRVLYCPESTLYHFESVSEGRHDHDEENRLRFLARWYDRVEPDEERIYAADGFPVDPRPIPESLFGLRYRLEQERLARHSWEVQAVRFAEKGARLLARLDELGSLRVGAPASTAALPEGSRLEPGGAAAAPAPTMLTPASGATAPEAAASARARREHANPILLSSDLPARIEAGSPVVVRLEVAFPGSPGAPGYAVELFWSAAGPDAAAPGSEGGLDAPGAREGEVVLAARAELGVIAEGLASGAVEVAPPVGRGQWDLVVLTAGSAGEKRELGRERVLVWPRYGARYEPHVPATALAGRTLRVPVVLRNTGMKVWDSGGTFQLGYRFRVPAAEGVTGAEHEGRCAAIGERVGPGEHLTILGAVQVPDRPGTFQLEFDLVEEGVAWFSHLGVAPEVTTLEVAARSRALDPAADPGRAHAGDPLSSLLDERDQLLRLERMEAELRRQRLIARVAELEAGAAWLSSEVAALKAARADVIEQLGAEQKERERTVAELEAEQRRRDGLDRRLQEIEGSRLFRLLGPLRRWMGGP